MHVVAHTQLSGATLDALMALEARIFPDPYPRARILRRASAAHNLLVLLAHVGDRVAGYKLGYELTDRVYYSWIGGVDPDFRRQGIAAALMDAQHAQAREWGYQRVRTHTENRFRAMLLLNIQQGFDVVGVAQSGERLVIQLEKPLPRGAATR